MKSILILCVCISFLILSSGCVTENKEIEQNISDNDSSNCVGTHDLSGSSMTPEFNDGDKIDVNYCFDETELKVGDTVVFYTVNPLTSFIHHRIIWIDQNKRMITTKGDNNDFPDRNISFRQIVAKTIAHYPKEKPKDYNFSGDANKLVYFDTNVKIGIMKLDFDINARTGYLKFCGETATHVLIDNSEGWLISMDSTFDINLAGTIPNGFWLSKQLFEMDTNTESFSDYNCLSFRKINKDVRK